MAEEKKKGFFKRLAEGLSKTRTNIVSGFDSIFTGYSQIDDDFYEEIEEILIMGDIGIHATTGIIDDLKAKVKEQHIKQPQECRELLMESIRDQMNVTDTDYEFENRKSIVLVVGVNGVGKTTSIGKLAGLLKDEGHSVILAAADTFRAAAGEQLTEWAQRAGVPIVSGQEGSDPGSVVYDAISSARAKNADILIVDTAGRLHNKKNLMNELGKINRIIDREYPEASSVETSNSALTNASASNFCRSSIFSPTPIYFTGIPSSEWIATAIPPFAVPSSLVRIIPVMGVTA